MFPPPGTNSISAHAGSCWLERPRALAPRHGPSGIGTGEAVFAASPGGPGEGGEHVRGPSHRLLRLLRSDFLT